MRILKLDKAIKIVTILLRKDSLDFLSFGKKRNPFLVLDGKEFILVVGI